MEPRSFHPNTGPTLTKDPPGSTRDEAAWMRAGEENCVTHDRPLRSELLSPHVYKEAASQDYCQN